MTGQRIALLTLVACAPFLALPELVPAGIRLQAVSVLATAAVLLAGGRMRPPGSAHVAFWIFCLALLASWWLASSRTAVSLRHFAGAGLGVLLMAVTAEWARTPGRLRFAVGLFAAAACIALLGGLAGTLIFPSKPIGPIQVPEAPYFWLPRRQFGLPGLSDNGHVNPNALGGTALMLLPLCAALAFDLTARGGRKLAGALGAIAAMLGLIALALTLSRSAWAGAFILVCVLALRWKRGRIVIAALAAVLTLALVVARPFEAAAGGTDATFQSLAVRGAIWKDALVQLRTSPVIGLGINEFHTITPSYLTENRTTIPHAHNIFIQTALDVGIVGLAAYIVLVGLLLVSANRSASRGDAGRLAAGAGLSILGVHLFGLTDAIALGAKVGIFQWLASGIVLAAAGVISRDAPGREPH